MQLYIDDEDEGTTIKPDTEEFCVNIENNSSGLISLENNIHNNTCGIMRWVYQSADEIIPMTLLSIHKTRG